MVTIVQGEPHHDEPTQRGWSRRGWSRRVVTLVGIEGGPDAVWQVKRGFADELRADGWGTESAWRWRGSVGAGWTILGEALLDWSRICGLKD